MRTLSGEVWNAIDEEQFFEGGGAKVYVGSDVGYLDDENGDLIVVLSHGTPIIVTDYNGSKFYGTASEGGKKYNGWISEDVLTADAPPTKRVLTAGTVVLGLGVLVCAAACYTRLKQ